MLNALQMVLGTGVLLVTFVDALTTTLVVSAGAGPVSKRVLPLIWRLALRLHRTDTRSTVLTATGPLLLVLTLLLWVAGLWVGWTLIFLSGQSVVGQPGGVPASLGDVVYFTGMTIFTLGTGDLVAATSGWRIVMAAASFSGLFLVTLTITYLIQVVSAAVQRRTLAVHIHALGRTPDQMLRRAQDGDSFSGAFQQHLVDLTPQLLTSAEQHLAYPVLHYFHAREPQIAAPRAVALLDDSLLLFRSAPRPSPDDSAVQALAYAVQRYVHTATGIAWVPKADTPPLPPGGPEPDELTEDDVQRRTLLHRLLRSDGWSWPEGDPTPDRPEE